MKSIALRMQNPHLFLVSGVADEQIEQTLMGDLFLAWNERYGQFHPTNTSSYPGTPATSQYYSYDVGREDSPVWLLNAFMIHSCMWDRIDLFPRRALAKKRP